MVHRSPNPLRADPTRTKSIRDRFERDLRVRFRIFSRELFETVVTQDVFGLGRGERNFEKVFGATPTATLLRPLEPVENVGRREWAFLTDEAKLLEFEKWVAAETGFIIVPEGDRFWEQYTEEGYRKGAGRAFTDSNRAAVAASSGVRAQGFAAGNRQGFLTTMLGAPETVEKTKLLASRTFADLKGVTDTMRTQIGRVLTDGLVQGQNPRTIATEMSRRVGIARGRAEVIARTEIVRAHAEGQLDALERMGVTEIGVAVEWDTAGDTRVCPRCEAMSGAVFKVSESHGLIPRHPQCRCAFIPANVGEPTQGQVRSQLAIESKIDKSILKESTKRRSLKEAKARSVWPGKNKSISKKRPKSILG